MPASSKIDNVPHGGVLKVRLIFPIIRLSPLEFLTLQR
jgi:hypothetical protein